MEYKICLETFIRWEQLTGRSFQSMNYEDEEDVHRLLYCAYCVGVGCESTFDVFQKTLRRQPKLFNKAMKYLARYNTLTAQFAALTPDVQGEDIGEGEEQPQTSPFMGDIASRLVIFGGMDVHYVMREMSVADMLMFVKALNDKQRQEAESQRLWTYISILPHIDSKKMTSPQKLMMFPWEVEVRKQDAKRVVEEMRAEFESFMRGGCPSEQKSKTE